MNKKVKFNIKKNGFTLIEVLISLVIFSIISVAFIHFFSTTLDATDRINDRNDLLHEAQIAEQIMASKAKLAWRIFPPGTSIYMNDGKTTKNYLADSNKWIVGTDPIIAMILPPITPGFTNKCTNANRRYCFRFYAYYAIRRSDYINAISKGSAEALPPDELNKNTWVIMEFRRTITNVTDPSTITPPAGEAIYRSTKGRLLVEYVQPENYIPNYKIFNIYPDSAIDISIRMLKRSNRRVYRVPAKTEPPLTTRVLPRNLNAGK